MAEKIYTLHLYYYTPTGSAKEDIKFEYPTEKNNLTGFTGDWYICDVPGFFSFKDNCDNAKFSNIFNAKSGLFFAELDEIIKQLNRDDIYLKSYDYMMANHVKAFKKDIDIYYVDNSGAPKKKTFKHNGKNDDFHSFLGALGKLDNTTFYLFKQPNERIQLSKQNLDRIPEKIVDVMSEAYLATLKTTVPTTAPTSKPALPASQNIADTLNNANTLYKRKNTIQSLINAM